ncbi:hypothetical protein A3C89_02970 [Candidatus Kaiserbacteria bacterium RIFCSPHIGHO2_02_FULL_50_50]|uniref:Uncharacterized protein n=1 Tax=Candidatus Kaiserbacteria bacterium RIFCSPHIGHO2_02_FULL_50_50 TaxID=1798492 RepID=A0A1F6DCZ2_9BACT|nr:MAG: hypothetical protein A3C89_02970 [Candidatus Kaiserbacteria bacterium RIFCSPHIGHO2_02_FULL_50_50]
MHEGFEKKPRGKGRRDTSPDFSDDTPKDSPSPKFVKNRDLPKETPAATPPEETLPAEPVLDTEIHPELHAEMEDVDTSAVINPFSDLRGDTSMPDSVVDEKPTREKNNPAEKPLASPEVSKTPYIDTLNAADIAYAEAPTKDSFSAYLAILENFSEASPQEFERLLPTVQKKRKELAARAKKMERVPWRIQEELRVFDKIITQGSKSHPETATPLPPEIAEVTSIPDATVVTTSATTVPPKKEKLGYPAKWKLEPMEKKASAPLPHSEERKAGRGDPNDPTTWELEPLQKASEERGDLHDPKTWKLEPMEKPASSEEAPLSEPSTPPQSPEVSATEASEKPSTPARPEVLPSTNEPVHELAKDVEDAFTRNFSVDSATLRETPGFQNLNKSQQRLVLERFSSLVREDVHTKAVSGHLENLATIDRTPAATRFGKLKRVVRRSWHTATRSYQIGKREEGLHDAWSSPYSGKEKEKLRLLATLTQSIRAEDAFGVLPDGRIDFSTDDTGIPDLNTKLNALIREKPALGEAGAQERLSKLGSIIEDGIVSLRKTFPETLSSEHEAAFERLAAEWALRARREVVLGTFLEKNRSLEESLRGDEASRGFARSAFVERGGLMAAGFAGRGVLGTMCGFLALPLVGAGIGGFTGWRRKAAEQSDADLLARMGEKIPVKEAAPKGPDVSPAYLAVLRKGVEERLTAAKLKKDNDAEVRVLSQRLAEYDAQLEAPKQAPQSTPLPATLPEGGFGFDNGQVLRDKLSRLSHEYTRANEELRTQESQNADPALLAAQRTKVAALTERLAARIDYTQKRLMQQRVDIGGTPALRAGTLSQLALEIGTAETTLALHNSGLKASMRAHLREVSGVLAGRDKKVDAARLLQRKRAALEGAALGAGFTFAGAALSSILSENLPRVKLSMPQSIEQSEAFNTVRNAIADIRGTNTFALNDKFPLPEKDGAAMDALMQKFSTPETGGAAPVSDPLLEKDEAATQALKQKFASGEIAPETVVGSSGGFQIPLNATEPEAPNEFTNRLHAMQEALRQKPSPYWYENEGTVPTVENNLQGISGNEYLSPDAERLIAEHGGSARDLAKAQEISNAVAVDMQKYQQSLQAGNAAQAQEILSRVHQNLERLNERFGPVFDLEKLPSLQHVGSTIATGEPGTTTITQETLPDGRIKTVETTNNKTFGGLIHSTSQSTRISSPN